MDSTCHSTDRNARIPRCYPHGFNEIRNVTFYPDGHSISTKRNVMFATRAGTVAPILEQHCETHYATRDRRIGTTCHSAHQGEHKLHNGLLLGTHKQLGRCS